MYGALWRSLRAPLTRPMARQMASHPTPEELGLTGWKYYLNSETIVGRRNIVLAVYGTLTGIYIFSKLRKPKKEATPQAN
ncbi:unnamed protein product [Porites lobata]|uniref:Uncharacterized protein n=1 Tax=Porites lobata TaxID=104759 RepID=A0ABN8NWV8_9CNID|nr:unnamed protein product [Porites lobata]